MIEPANRISSIQEYYFSHKLRTIGEMNANGEEVINLGIGNPDLMPDENSMQVFAQALATEGNHGYQSYKGIPELRSAFSAWYKQYFKVDLNAESEILPLMGSKEGIMHISMAYLNPGDHVLIPDPGYPTYKAVTSMLGAKAVNYDLLPENNWFPNFEELEKLDLSKVKLMWVNYPNMPTGQAANSQLLERLIAFGIKHNILICNDNPYSLILNKTPNSIFSIPNAKEVALELNSLSKSHNLAGLRIGMVAGNSTFINNLLKVKSNMDSGMFKPSQLAAAKALENQPQWFDALNNKYAMRREIAWKIFNKLNISFDKNQVGMFVWGKIQNSSLSDYDLSDMLLEKSKVFITPGSIFGKNGKNYMRLSLCSNENTLIQAQHRIETQLTNNK